MKRNRVELAQSHSVECHMKILRNNSLEHGNLEITLMLTGVEKQAE